MIGRCFPDLSAFGGVLFDGWAFLDG